MSVIRWEDPPPSHSDRQEVALAHDLIAYQLRRQPKEWAVVAEWSRDTGLAGAIGRARMRAYSPRGAFEAVTRIKDGVPTVYARYVGEES